MIDGDENSFYWTNSPASADSYFGIDLGRVKTVYSVKVMMGKDDSEGDIMPMEGWSILKIIKFG